MIVVRVLQKVLVNYFYKVNAGFFLFGFFVLFGLPYSPLAFHLSLINGIIQSQQFLAVVMFCWLLYNIKCIGYTVKQLHESKQNFLFCFNNLTVEKTLLYLLYVQVLIYMPVLLYASAIVWFALQKHQYLIVVETVVFNAVLMSASALIYVRAIQKQEFFYQKISLLRFAINLPKTFFSIPLYFLWSGRKQMLFVTKVFSLLLLFGFIKLYEPERYDIRPMQLCLLLSAASHSAIVYEIRAFEEEFLAFSRNLPVTTFQRFINTIFMYATLMIPEFIFLLKGYRTHFTFADYPQLVLLVIALLLMFHSVLLIENTEMEQLIRIVFGIMAACFFIILYNPGVWLSVAILLLSFALFTAYYYDFEKRH